MLRAPWYLIVIFGCTWAVEHPTTAVTEQITADEFKETTVYEWNQTLADDRPITVFETTISTEGTRGPKYDDDTSALPKLDTEKDLVLAYNNQVHSFIDKLFTTPAGPKKQCGKRLARNARIVGGKDTYEGEFPWAVSVRLLTTHSCGGTIINKYWILTAAHCVKRYSARYFRIRTGDNNIGVRGFRHDLDIHVAEISIHPNFGKPRRYSNDVALLKLKKPLKFDTYIQPICLPNPDDDFAGRNATAVGWGATKEENNDRPNKMQKVLVPILNNSLCADWYADVYNGYVQIYDYQICAGYKEGGMDACQGDSGGPLVMKEGDHFTLIGIVSAGVGCARRQLPGIYSRITLFVPWIQKITEL